MTVSTTTQRLAAMYALIPGINKTFAYIPRILSPAQLPAVIIEPGEASYDMFMESPDTVMETRVYRGNFFFDLALFGTEQQTESGVLPLIDSIIDYFLQRPGLELDGATEPQVVVFDSTMLRDGGFVRIDYPAGGDKVTTFGGFVFSHQVRELRRNAFKD